MGVTAPAPPRALCRFTGRIIPRHQHVDLAMPVAVENGGERVAQICKRIDSIELTDFDQRSDGRPALCSRIQTS